MRNAGLFIALIHFASAQSPTGGIDGVVRDPSGAIVAAAHVKVVSRGTGWVRTASTSDHGAFSIAALPAGQYDLNVEAVGFQRQARTATVEAGVTTLADFVLLLGDVTESATVSGAIPQLRYDSHTVGGLVGRSQIEGLPLNGRGFLELGKLEPGVQAATRASSNRMFVPVLGAPVGNSGRGTRVTVDGGSIMAVGNGGSSLGLSQEVVQEFQISTVNFDLSTGLTFAGSINLVTRSGGNEPHGTVFYFFRDHKLAAHPALTRDPANPDPFFQRRQFGFALGGPVRRDRLFFFVNWERNEQRSVSATTLAGDFAHLSRITPSPSFGNQASLRLDGQLSPKHTAFLRYSHDGARGFGPTNLQPNAYPSGWTRQFAWADLNMFGLTSVVRPSMINDFRFAYFFVSSRQGAAQEEDCPECLGIGAPAITVVGTGLALGFSTQQLNLGRRFQLHDSVSWQTGAHRVRFGVDWEFHRGGFLSWNHDPVTMSLFSPDDVRNYNGGIQPPSNLIPLPASFETVDDILRLPLQSTMTGIGDPRVPQQNGNSTRTWSTLRVYFQDAWRLHPSLTVNYGLAWNIDRYRNYDLAKPALLAPILGQEGLGPTRKAWKNFSPVLGLAWSPRRGGKTVIRAGAGIFYDFLFGLALDTERALLGSPGLGRRNFQGGAIANTLPGIPGFPAGRPLTFTQGPTRFTGRHLMEMLPSARLTLEQARANADPALMAIQIDKQATSSLFPSEVPSSSAQHVNVGLQRQMAADFVVNADFVYRHFLHVGPGGLDLNRFNRVAGPVIPRCSDAQRIDPLALCSTGPINVHVAAGRATYRGLLVRADKRFSRGFQALGSYAFSRNNGPNLAPSGGPGTGFNLDDWLAATGPLATDFTHVANVAGVVRLPWRVEAGFNFSYASAPPFNAFVSGNDFNGDGTFGDLLPGSTVGGFNRGLGREDLERLVGQFNENYAGRNDPQGRPIRRISLPSQYAFDDRSHSLDLRISRSFGLTEGAQLLLIGEVFNLYNSANLTGFSGDLNSAAFGQPSSRLTQAFGSSGPRAFQIAARVNF